jgi:DNA-binding FadR family transcriptional regulator
MPNGMRGECKLLAPAHNKCLAQMLGVSRESFSRTLGEMEKEGILSRRNGWRIFLDPERLWHAPEIESLVESNRGPIGHFTLTDPIYA